MGLAFGIPPWELVDVDADKVMHTIALMEADAAGKEMAERRAEQKRRRKGG